ncbi:uncharacterized protein BDV14DRAFT_47519 [Aspergillus stella-maris]|uniref:uncharacterized protein n=1 Tax=Aspergillus stella-maris TaxID=1810926 RepID=UPI003CCE3264
MNNEQFRRLLVNNNQPSKPSSASPTGSSQSPPGNARQSHGARSPQGGSSGGHSLGSRMRSSIPMTPRNLQAPNFAAQLSEYRRDRDGGPPNKKFKSSAAPKGTKLPAGYEDRAAARVREGEGVSGIENELKLKELEEKLKKGLIDERTFTRVRKELGFGGDLDRTRMVKGLDWDLLRRVRAGEDVEMGEKEKDEGEEDKGVAADEGEGPELDMDDEFDKVLEGKGEEALPSAPREKEKKKKGSMAPPPAPAQRKTRDEILKELRASRAAAAAAVPAAAPQPELALGARFKKIGDSSAEKKRFIEQDENGRRREVLLITDAEGKTKRKTRWLDPPGTKAPIAEAAPSAPGKEAQPLGMDVPAEIAAKIKAAQDVKEDSDDDIFAGVGADYDPLGGAGSDEDSSDSEGEEGEVAPKPKAPQEPSSTDKKDSTDEPRIIKPRNYFGTSTTGQEEDVEGNRDRGNPLTRDPTLLAALKRAAALRQAGSADDDGVEGADEEDVDPEVLARRKKFLEEARRREALDAADMDYGFGGSRNEDDEDEEAILLEPRGGNKRKRGPKKKKGDKDSASDVLGVLEGRKKDA